MNKYQFEKIYGQMAREHGKIRRGQEEPYTMLFFAMESNALKVHRQYPQSNSRRMMEAIGLVLYDVQERYTGNTVDVSKFRNENNERLEHALLMAFDPFTNEEVMESVKQHYGEEELTPGELKRYYRSPVRCLLKIKSSVELWGQQMGSNGYFQFIEGHMGRQIHGTDMRYAIMLPPSN